jgi:hypothetical protein
MNSKEQFVGAYKKENAYVYYIAIGPEEYVFYKDGVLMDLPYTEHSVTSVTIQGDIYTRVYPNVDIEKEFAEGISPTVKKGSTRRTIRIGPTIVFKSSASNNTALNAILPEISRNLIGLSKGLTHAINYGIYNDHGKFYIMEERLDTTTFDAFICKARGTIQSLCSTTTIDKLRWGNVREIGGSMKYIYEYLAFFAELLENLRTSDIGGDFKLDNVAFKHGTTEYCCTDVVLPSHENPYIPKSWDEWYWDIWNRKDEWKTGNDEKKAKYADQVMSIFTDPLLRLMYVKSCTTTIGGRTRKRRSTRRH